MATKKQKLELTWIGKENRPKLEPRILLENPDKSYHLISANLQPVVTKPQFEAQSDSQRRLVVEEYWLNQNDG
jgi:hypothetical protein